tara:strand:- start:2143 stop:2640 length:498 start_codon:yes stop_codon:yes gene_type:complete
MTITVSIVLNEAEQKLATFLATKRYQNARSKGIKDNKIGDQSNMATDLEGMAAEIAACRLLNVYPDLQTENIPVHDLITGQGYTVDVKVTKYESGKLLAVRNKIKHPSDFYMLMIGTFPTYRCAGFAPKDDLLCESTLTDLGKGEGHALNQSELIPIGIWSKMFN